MAVAASIGGAPTDAAAVADFPEASPPEGVTIGIANGSIPGVNPINPPIPGIPLPEATAAAAAAAIMGTAPAGVRDCPPGKIMGGFLGGLTPLLLHICKHICGSSRTNLG